MQNSKIINAVAAATSLAVLGGLYLFLHPGPPALDRAPHEALGARLAEEALRLQEPGARIIVIARDPVPFHVPACAAQLDGFLAKLKKSGHSPDSIRGVKLDPLRPVAVPSGDFFDLLRLGRGNDVIVSLLGPPELEPQQYAKLGSKRAHVIAVCSGSLPTRVDLERLFAQELLTAAVISRAEPLPPTAGAKGFDRLFKLITPANLGELEAASTGRN